MVSYVPAKWKWYSLLHCVKILFFVSEFIYDTIDHHQNYGNNSSDFSYPQKVIAKIVTTYIDFTLLFIYVTIFCSLLV